jgi:hypothetical protein
MDRLEDVDPRVQAPFSKDDVRLVQVATRLVLRIQHGQRAVEEALRSAHVVMVPMLDAKGNPTTPIIT